MSKTYSSSDYITGLTFIRMSTHFCKTYCRIKLRQASCKTHTYYSISLTSVSKLTQSTGEIYIEAVINIPFILSTRTRDLQKYVDFFSLD